MSRRVLSWGTAVSGGRSWRDPTDAGFPRGGGRVPGISTAATPATSPSAARAKGIGDAPKLQRYGIQTASAQVGLGSRQPPHSLSRALAQAGAIADGQQPREHTRQQRVVRRTESTASDRARGWRGLVGHSDGGARLTGTQGACCGVEVEQRCLVGQASASSSAMPPQAGRSGRPLSSTPRQDTRAPRRAPTCAAGGSCPIRPDRADRPGGAASHACRCSTLPRGNCRARSRRCAETSWS